MRHLDQVRQCLCTIVGHRSLATELKQDLENTLQTLKTQAVECGDQEAAKLAWCYERILSIHDSYLSAFHDIRDGNYYSAWCSFERVEISLHHLEPHFELDGDEYGLDFIAKHTKQFQSLFPYKFFISPAMLVKRKVCSVCGNSISVRNPCGHQVGEIYDGEMCYRKIEEVEIIEVSLVDTPGHKYSVVFFGGSEGHPVEDSYNYSVVRYVADGLRNPFDAWDMRWTKRRHPHAFFSHVGEDEECPCESGEQYIDCCLQKSGVLRPHLEITFSVPPPEEQLEIQYMY